MNKLELESHVVTHQTQCVVCQEFFFALRTTHIPVKQSSVGVMVYSLSIPSLWFSVPNLHLRFAQLPPSRPPNCLIRLDVGALIVTAAAVLQSGGNYPLIAFLLTCICYFDVALAPQTITKKQHVYSRLISSECSCQMAPQEWRIRVTRAFVECFWCDNCEINAMSLFVGLEEAASKCTFPIFSSALNAAYSF